LAHLGYFYLLRVATPIITNHRYNNTGYSTTR